MRIYLDVCCLNRLNDDQTQDRIRLEAQALQSVFDSFRRGEHEWVSSAVVEDEIGRDPNPERRDRTQDMLAGAGSRLSLSMEAIQLARTMAGVRILARDGLHLAVALMGGCDVFLTTDDRLIRRVGRLRPPLQMTVCNPIEWVAREARS